MKKVKFANGKELVLNQTIEYNDPDDRKMSMAKITEFRKMDTDVVWMYITDLENPNKRHWLSCNNYAEQFLTEKVIPQNADTESQNTEEYPF